MNGTDQEVTIVEMKEVQPFAAAYICTTLPSDRASNGRELEDRATQEEMLRLRTEKDGVVIGFWVDESEATTDPRQRPGLTRAIELMGSQQYRLLYAICPDAVTPDEQWFGGLRDAFTRIGLELRFVREE
jgi:hypothetical protein